MNEAGRSQHADKQADADRVNVALGCSVFVAEITAETIRFRKRSLELERWALALGENGEELARPKTTFRA